MTTPAHAAGRDSARAALTRARLLDATERVVAEHGLAAMTQRRIAEAAGQANNSAVGYHFGDRTQLVRAVIARHAEPMDRRRRVMLDAARGSHDMRDHVACLVRPLTEHLDELGVPTWYARFAAHVTTDLSLREHVLWESTASEAMRDAVAAVAGTQPDGVSATATAMRAQMARYVIVQTCAEREAALAEGSSSDPTSWEGVATVLVDALTGLLMAPETRWSVDGAGSPYDVTAPRLHNPRTTT